MRTIAEAFSELPSSRKPIEAQPRILIWDIENSPAIGKFWGPTYNTNIVKVIKQSSVICFAAKWHGSSETEFWSDFHDGHEVMLKRAWQLLHEADAVVSYNGTKHDTPHMMTEFRLLNWGPPSPRKEIDLYRVTRHNFKFQQNKLGYVSEQLQIGEKVAHEGFELWEACEAGDPEAWARMEEYNRQDVNLTEELFDDHLPWIPQSMLPHPKLYGAEGNCCGRCGSNALIKDETPAATPLGLYERFFCPSCNSWSRGKKKLQGVDARGI